MVPTLARGTRSCTDSECPLTQLTRNPYRGGMNADVVRAGLLIIGANLVLWTSEPWAPILSGALVISALVILRNTSQA